MKKSLGLLIICILISSRAFSWNGKVYIPKNEKFVEYVLNDMPTRSVKDIAESLGYNSGMYYFYSKNYKFETVFLFKILSKDLICVMTKHDYGGFITIEQVERILAENEYSYSEAYPLHSLELDLNEGIENKCLTKTFMEDVTHNKVIDDKLIDNLNGYIYTFENNVLVSYTGLDGLIGLAKELKDTPTYNTIKSIAEHYYSDPSDVVEEINMQFGYLSQIEPSYYSLAKSDKYNFNYALLYVDLYCPKISMSEFIRIVHNQAGVLSVTPTETILKYNFNYYVFDSNKILREVRM